MACTTDSEMPSFLTESLYASIAGCIIRYILYYPSLVSGQIHIIHFIHMIFFLVSNLFVLKDFLHLFPDINSFQYGLHFDISRRQMDWNLKVKSEISVFT